MDFKKLIFKFRVLYLFLPTKFLLKITGEKLILPFYHTVIGDELNFTNHLYSAKTEKEFENDLCYLLKYFKPIDVFTLIKIKSGEIQNFEPSFFLSFDDGLSKIHQFIAPLLLRANVQATFFLNSDFIDNKALFYRYKVNLIISHIHEFGLTEQQLLGIGKITNLNFKDKTDVIKRLKECTHDNNFELDEIASLLKISIKDFLENEKPYLESQQIKNLILSGFNIGAHSCSHPRYDLIDFDNKLSQTNKSVVVIAKAFNLDYKLFAFPFSDVGVSKLFFKEMETKSIYTFGTSGLKEENLKMHFQRIPMEYTSKYSAKTIIKGELFYYILKRIFGKNKIKRD